MDTYLRLEDVDLYVVKSPDTEMRDNAFYLSDLLRENTTFASYGDTILTIELTDKAIRIIGYRNRVKFIQLDSRGVKWMRPGDAVETDGSRRMFGLDFPNCYSCFEEIIVDNERQILYSCADTSPGSYDLPLAKLMMDGNQTLTMIPFLFNKFIDMVDYVTINPNGSEYIVFHFSIDIFVTYDDFQEMFDRLVDLFEETSVEVSYEQKILNFIFEIKIPNDYREIKKTCLMVDARHINSVIESSGHLFRRLKQHILI